MYTNLFSYPLYVGICLLMMLVYSVLYFFAAIYVERINPGEFGVARPFYYIFPTCCCKKKETAAISPVENPMRSTSGTERENGWIELNPLGPHRRATVTTHNLTKVSSSLLEHSSCSSV